MTKKCVVDLTDMTTRAGWMEQQLRQIRRDLIDARTSAAGRATKLAQISGHVTDVLDAIEKSNREIHAKLDACRHAPRSMP